MQYSHFMLFLGACTASPLIENSKDKSEIAKRSYLSNEALNACTNATNCETYETSSGTMIRFKEGMGPGSASHAALDVHSKRDDDNVHTYVTFGDGSVNYGKAGASGSGGILHHLYDACHEGACDTSDATYKTSAVLGGALFDVDMILHPEGAYDGWDARNVFIDALVAGASQGEQCEDATWYLETNSETGQRTPEGTLHQCTQTNFIAINRHLADGSLQGFIQVRVEQEVEGSGWCATISGVLGDISGVIGAVPGVGEAAGIAGGFFGLINTLCS